MEDEQRQARRQAKRLKRQQRNHHYAKDKDQSDDQKQCKIEASLLSQLIKRSKKLQLQNNLEVLNRVLVLKQVQSKKSRNELQQREKIKMSRTKKISKKAIKAEVEKYKEKHAFLRKKMAGHQVYASSDFKLFG